MGKPRAITDGPWPKKRDRTLIWICMQETNAKRLTTVSTHDVTLLATTANFSETLATVHWFTAPNDANISLLCAY